MKHNWYSKAGQAPHFQSQVADEQTGETIAVVYNDPDGSKGELIAAAPETVAELDRLRELNAELVGALMEAAWFLFELNSAEENSGVRKALSKAHAAIAKATQP